MAEESAVAEPQIVEPAPTSTPEVRPELKNLLDKKMRSRSPQRKAPAAPPPPAAAPEPAAAAEPSAPVAKPSAALEPPTKTDLPSFLRETLQPPAEPKPEAPAAPAELPEDFAAAETDPKKKEDLARFRTEYKKRGDEIARLSAELAAARDAGTKPSPETEAKLKQLEETNSALAARVGVENHPQFRALLAQRQQAVGYVQNALKELGADPAGVARVLSATNLKDRYEAITQVTENLPQAARDELANVFRTIGAFDSQIINARKNYSETYAQLQQRDLEAGKQAIEAEKQNWGKTFDNLWNTMRDKSGVEVFRKSDDPKDADWNARVDAMQENARRIVLDNDDPAKLIAAVQLGHAADAYRSLFYSTRESLTAALKKIAAYERATPNINPEIGAERTAEPSITPGKPNSPSLGKLGLEFLHKQKRS